MGGIGFTGAQQFWIREKGHDVFRVGIVDTRRGVTH